VKSATSNRTELLAVCRQRVIGVLDLDLLWGELERDRVLSPTTVAAAP